MSKAFTKEEDDAPERDAPLPPRPRDPSPVSPRGRQEMLRAQQRLVDEGRADTREARVLQSVLDTTREKPPVTSGSDAGFGCAVVVEDGEGRRKTWEIVGPDEADPARGRVSLVSPLGRALLGRAVGDTVTVVKPAGEEELTVISITPF